MRLIRAPVALPLACLFLVLGCSKTEDVAPERKIFGNPPTIVNFRILNPDGTEATSPVLTPERVSCDFSETIQLHFCTRYGNANPICDDGSGSCDPLTFDRDNPAGCNFACSDGVSSCPPPRNLGDECGFGGFCRLRCSDGSGACPPSAGENFPCGPTFEGLCESGGKCVPLPLSDLRASPPVVLGGEYTQIRFDAVVSDPDTVRDDQGRITENNILLVASSFVLPNDKSEVTLVLFDDGGANKFPQPGKFEGGVGTNCRVDGLGGCRCEGRMFEVDSNDMTKDDGTYSRGFAIVNNTTSPWLQDCIMRDKRQVPYPAQPGSRLRFRIDAVDRQGNLDTWEQTPEVIVGVDQFSCTGDSCGCCLVRSSDPTSDCRGLAGMISAKTPNGLCVDLLS